MYKSGFVALSGQPNVGKSTLLNGFLKEKIAIMSRRPETTRDNIRGILTEDDCQIIFVDTPGIHKPHDLLGKIMLTRAQSTLMESNIILFITEKNIAFNREDKLILDRLPKEDEDKKVILVINKVDKVKEKTRLLPLMEKAQSIYPFAEIIPVCALHEKDLDKLLGVIKKYIPEGPQLYPDDQISDKDNIFMIQEIIREKILYLTREEIPHSVAVIVEDILEDEENKGGIPTLHTTIYVERASQRSILIGKGGEMIKKIRRMAQLEIEDLLEGKVHIDLWVKVFERWKKDPHGLREFGYSD